MPERAARDLTLDEMDIRKMLIDNAIMRSARLPSEGRGRTFESCRVRQLPSHILPRPGASELTERDANAPQRTPARDTYASRVFHGCSL